MTNRAGGLPPAADPREHRPELPHNARKTAAHSATRRAPAEVLPAEARAREEARDGAAGGPPGEQNDWRRARRVRHEREGSADMPRVARLTPVHTLWTLRRRTEENETEEDA